MKLSSVIDIAMAVITLLLMGGDMFFSSGIVHEILGIVLFALWGIHLSAHRRWYLNLLKGHYSAFRIFQTVINCGILICAIFLMISGIMLSNHVFTFLGIESGASFARTAHLLSSHWYLILMSLHIGLHAGLVFKKMPFKGKAFRVPFCSLTILVAGYGLYAFLYRGLWKYMTLQQPFYFLNLEKGYVGFILEYISIIFLFATLSSILSCAVQKLGKNS